MRPRNRSHRGISCVTRWLRRFRDTRASGFADGCDCGLWCLRNLLKFRGGPVAGKFRGARFARESRCAVSLGSGPVRAEARGAERTVGGRSRRRRARRSASSGTCVSLVAHGASSCPRHSRRELCGEGVAAAAAPRCARSGGRASPFAWPRGLSAARCAPAPLVWDGAAPRYDSVATRERASFILRKSVLVLSHQGRRVVGHVAGRGP